MSNEKKIENESEAYPVEETTNRREFLLSLKKWSKVVIGLAVVGAAGITDQDAEAGSWINRRGGWINRPWSNGGSWANSGSGGWVNRHGGGGWANGSDGSWANRRGGVGWVNFR